MCNKARGHKMNKMKQVLTLLAGLAILVTIPANLFAQEGTHPVYEISKAFAKVVPNYASQKKMYNKILDKQKKLLFTLSEDRNMLCSKQILNEATWLLHNTADFDKIKLKLEKLVYGVSLAESGDAKSEEFELLGAGQSPTDGSWGGCYDEWFWKLVESQEQINYLTENDKSPDYPTTFLDKINTPDKLLAYLNSLLITDIENEKISKRRELNESFSAIIRLVLRKQPKTYVYDAELADVLIKFSDDKWQNQDTGFWGGWFKEGDKIIKTDDLSITFHMVNYRKGDVKLLKKIAKTTLEIKNKPYPYGWYNGDGTRSNHHHMDVVKLLRYTWKELDDGDRTKAVAEIQEMLDWCLKKSLTKEGFFRYSDDDDSLEDSYEFGTSFLKGIGFFDKSKRFWTDKDFPEAKAIGLKIIANMKSLKNKSSRMQETISELENEL